ncbi:MAG: hypothetical protein EP343_14850 [Deltaproteobacteria bacterium]|nr:MAG: hypothetical protein EP343_14850 [Deltaproteobacteria bacterium]
MSSSDSSTKPSSKPDSTILGALHDALTKQPDIEPLGNEQYKVDLDLGTEKLWLHLSLWSFGAGALFLLGMISHIPRRPSGIAVAFLLGLAFALIRWFTDNYYIVDLNRMSLLHHRSFLGLRRVSVAAKLSDLLALIIESQKVTRGTSGYQSTVWKYRATAISKSGKRIPLSGYRQSMGLDRTNEYLLSLSELVGAKAYPGEKFHFPDWSIKNGQHFSIQYHPYTNMWGLKIWDGTFNMLLKLMGAAFVFGLWLWTY